MKKIFKAGPAGYITIFFASLPFMLVDMYVAGMTFDQSLIVRIVIVACKVLFAGRYDRVRDKLIWCASVRRLRKPRLTVDMIWWPTYCAIIYTVILGAFMTPLETMFRAIGVLVITAAFGGPIVGVLLDLLKRTFKHRA